MPPGPDERPDPDALLERYGFVDRWSNPKRGRMRVYLGAAPGVGKTYAMLREGHRLHEQGLDVAVGFVETHGRAETAAQVCDLEVVPRQRIAYRGVTVEEMDTEAVIALHPNVALVDELAHSNPPGSARERRWQDVDAIRDAGIDVLTTLNVQHLESLHDVVAGITGVEVRETVPDRVLDGAQVQLVDLPVEHLLDRLAEGKVYPSQRARLAREHFFRPGNLTALRELALRRTAAGVDDQLDQFMRESTGAEVWQATERVLALLEDDVAPAQVLRSAWRLAGALRAELVAALVQPGGPTPAGGDPARDRRLAEDLGAVVVDLPVRSAAAADLAEAAAELARRHRATVVVAAYRPPAGRWPVGRRALADELFALLDGVDVYLVEPRGGDDRDTGRRQP